jgi:hypothetical protein
MVIVRMWFKPNFIYGIKIENILLDIANNRGLEAVQLCPMSHLITKKQSYAKQQNHPTSKGNSHCPHTR